MLTTQIYNIAPYIAINRHPFMYALYG